MRNYITLSEIGERTGLGASTLLRYAHRGILGRPIGGKPDPKEGYRFFHDDFRKILKAIEEKRASRASLGGQKGLRIRRARERIAAKPVEKPAKKRTKPAPKPSKVRTRKQLHDLLDGIFVGVTTREAFDRLLSATLARIVEIKKELASLS